MRPRPHRMTPLAVALALAGCNGLADDDNFGRTGDGVGGVEGTICLPDRITGMQGATVEVFVDADEDGVPDGDTAAATTTTDLEGTWVIEQLEAGPYVGMASRGHFEHVFAFDFVAGNRATIQNECMPSDAARITMIEGTCDDPSLLYEGAGFEVTDVASDTQEWIDLLTNANGLSDVDILLLPCGLPEGWVPQAPTVANVLGGFLDAGGSVYVSGSSWPLFETVDPDLIDFLRDDEDLDAPEVGFGETMNARVVDTTLAAMFTDGIARIRLADNWTIAEAVGDGATVLLEGDASTTDFDTVDSVALMVRAESLDRGTLVFSAWGKTGESNEDMDLAQLEALLSL